MPVLTRGQVSRIGGLRVADLANSVTEAPELANARGSIRRPALGLLSATGEIPAMVRSGGLSLLTNTLRRLCGPAQTSQPAHRSDHPTPRQPPSQLRRIQRVDHPIRRSGLSWKFKGLCLVIAARPAAGGTGER